MGGELYLPRCGTHKKCGRPPFQLVEGGVPQKNLYTFDQLVEALSVSQYITVHPTVGEDFLDYGKLISFIENSQVRFSKITSLVRDRATRSGSDKVPQHQESIL
jgi:hypothetical protein